MGYGARGYGYGRGYGFGYGMGFGRGYGYRARYAYMGDPTRCARFPWLQRWWWANPDYEATIPIVPPVPSPDQEKQYLADQVKYLEKELSNMRKRLEELSSKPETSEP
jgi:hypothetical protein